MSFLIILLYIFTGTSSIKVSGAFIPLLNENKTILIANHQIYMDFFYMWLLSWKNWKHSYVMFIAKNSIKYMPVFGHMMKILDFIFLKRAWNKDKESLKESVKRLCIKDQFWLLMFPEGTVMCKETKDKCTTFLSSQPRQNYNTRVEINNVLIPKARGLFTIFDTLQNVSKVYDLTIVYKDDSENYLKADKNLFPYDSWKLVDVIVKGKNPKFIHIHIDQYQIDQIDGFKFEHLLKDDEERTLYFSKWLQNTFRNKEKIIIDIVLNDVLGIVYHLDTTPCVRDVLDVSLMIYLFIKIVILIKNFF